VLTTHRTARILPVAAFLITALGACSDNSPPTAPLSIHPSFTQVAASPVVNSLNDPGTGVCDDTECTLREAITFASSGATITFAAGLTGTITLTSGELYLNKSLNISGPGPTALTISGGDATVLFWLTAGTTTISGLTLTHAYPSLGSGGGAIIVSNSGTTLALTNCAITNNNGGVYGGAIRVSDGNLTVSSCTLSGNTASSGAGIIVFAGSTRIVNSTISGNTGSSAVRAVGGAITIDHSTIVGNSQSGVSSAYSSPVVSVKGSIIWGNALYDVNGSQDNAFVSLGYNLIGTDDNGWVDFGHDFTATGDQTSVADAKLGALALNSPGATQTRALLSGSPAIDTGVCTDATGATLGTDQRGVSRPQGSACDKGAYELQASGGTTPTFTFDLSALSAKTFGDGDFSVASYATTNSTGAITFALGAGSVGCSVTSAGMVSITGAAINPSACLIEASLAADATYTSAGPLQQSFNIAKATGSVTIGNIPGSATVGGSFTPTYTIAGDGTASTVSNSTSVCTVSSGVVNYIAVGTCLLQASVTAGTNHLAATGSVQSFAISLVTPTFAFDLSALPAKTFGDGNFSVASYATTNSTGAITFALGAGSNGCSVTSAGMVTITGVALDPIHCVLAATLAAHGSYAAAGPIEDSLNIAKAAGSVSINNMPGSATVGGQFTPAFTTPSDGAVSVASLTTGVCTVTGGVVDFIAAGTCILQASVTEGTNYLAVTGSQQNVTVSPVSAVFSSTCTYTINAKNNQRQVTISWENADPGVTQIQVSDGRIVTKQLAPTATGSWSTNVKTGEPTYGLWGGTARRDVTTTLVNAGSACSLIP
jgi:CSLREA domain-containing protein